LFYKDIMTV